jgi:hypothetical protein
MIKRLGLAEQWAVRILCVLALLFVGLAHKPPAVAGPISAAELAQYILPDGSMATLCLPSEDGKTHHGSHDQGSGCEACRLSASVLLPVPADIGGEPVRHDIDRVVLLRSEAFYRQLFPPNTAPRGPPSSLTA